MHPFLRLTIGVQICCFHLPLAVGNFQVCKWSGLWEWHLTHTWGLLKMCKVPSHPLLWALPPINEASNEAYFEWCVSGSSKLSSVLFTQVYHCLPPTYCRQSHCNLLLIHKRQAKAFHLAGNQPSFLFIYNLTPSLCDPLKQIRKCRLCWWLSQCVLHFLLCCKGPHKEAMKWRNRWPSVQFL